MKQTGHVNEFNVSIPSEIVSKAEKKGCINSLYIYKEGGYHGKLPRASIGCSKPKRFRSPISAESMKVHLGDGWEVYRSPSAKASNRNRSLSSKAAKHTSILCQVEEIFECLPERYRIYLAHYAGEGYPKAEKKSNKSFYGLALYSTSEPKGSMVKIPDCIVVDDMDIIRYVIEVKWGCLKDYPGETDLYTIFKKKELEKIDSMISGSKVCRVIGPNIQNGLKVQGKESFDFKIGSNTEFLIVSDLKGAGFVYIKRGYSKERHLFSICDIKEKVDQFDSLKAYLARKHEKDITLL